MFYLIYVYILYTKEHQQSLALPWLGDIWEGFQASPKGFKIVFSPHTVFYTLMFIRYLYTNVLYMHIRFSYFIMFSTSRCSRLETFIVYSIHSLSMLYIHSSHFLIFRLRSCQVLLLHLAPSYYGETPSILLGCR